MAKAEPAIPKRERDKVAAAFYAEHADQYDAIVPQRTIINALYSGYLTVPDVLEKVNPEHPVFSHPEYERIFRAMLDAYESSQPISRASIPSGEADLSTDDLGFPPDALAYLAASQTRRISIRLQVDAIAEWQKAKTCELPARIAGIAHSMLNLVESRAESPVKSATQAHDDALGQLSGAVNAHRNGRLAGMMTGIEFLDTGIGGLKPGELSVVMTGTSTGKSIFMGQTARIAAQSGSRVFVFTLEMTTTEYKQRWWSSLTGISLGKIRHGAVTNQEWDEIRHLKDEISRWKVSIDDRSGCNIAQIVARVKAMSARVGKPDLIVVDYLQRIAPMSGEDGERELARSAKELKNLAKDLRCHVMTASQINEKDMRSRAGKDSRPKIADVKGAMAINEESDVVIAGCRLALKEDRTDCEMREFAILKHRNGPLIGYKPVIFWKDWMLFSNQNPRGNE